MKQLIEFVETNIDGCGTDAEVIISVSTDKRLNYQEIEDTIKNIKSKTLDEDWDTDSMVEEVCEKCFSNNGIKWQQEIPITIEF